MSKTGNTKKVAEAIFAGIPEEKKEIASIDKVGSLAGYDLAFLGFPIHREGPDKQTAQLLEKHCVSGRNVVLFITHAAPEDHPDLPPMLAKFKAIALHANLIDMFDCQGELDKTTKRIMSVLPSAKYRQWARQDNSQGQPDQARLDRARTFGRDVLKRFHDMQHLGERRSSVQQVDAVTA
jgi:hypothetical protein